MDFDSYIPEECFEWDYRQRKTLEFVEFLQRYFCKTFHKKLYKYIENISPSNFALTIIKQILKSIEFKENIRNYIFLKDGIKDLENRIMRIENQRETIKDSVRGSHREFPYTIHTCVVEGKEKDERLKRRKKLLNNKKKELEKIKDELEIYVNTEIKDEQIRQLFMYRYIDK